MTVISALVMQTQFLKPLNPGIVRRSPNIIVARNSFRAAPHFLANLALTTYSHHPLHSLQCQGELVQLEILYLKLIIFINPKWIMLNKIYKYLPSSQMIEAKIHWHPLVASSSEIHCLSVLCLHVCRSLYYHCLYLAVLPQCSVTRAIWRLIVLFIWN